MIVAVEPRGPDVGTVRLQRLDKRNAISHELVDQVEAGIAELGTAVTVLEADGPVFSAGADLVEVGAGERPPAADRLLALLVEVDTFVVAQVDGVVVGAGVGMVACCPVVLASDRSTFVLPERALGVFPAGMLAYLEGPMGARRALDLGLRGEPIDAVEACDVGLVNEVHPVEHLASATDRWIERLLDQPEVTRTAGAAWRSRFAEPAVVGRKAHLDAMQVLPRVTGGVR